MNSTLKPVLPASPQTTTAATPAKPMHPQGAPMSYGQPSGTISQTPYPNTNMAHNHPSSQQNHFSLSSGSHFTMGGAIPPSNHPVAISHSSGGQAYNPPKNVSYSSGFQHGGGPAQNQNTIPPVSQTLPATTSPSPAPLQNATSNSSNSNANSTPQSKEPSVEKEKPQPNGTAEEESPAKADKPDVQENHVAPQPSSTPELAQIQAKPTPSQTSTTQELTTEKPKPPVVPPQETKSVQEPPKEKIEESPPVTAPITPPTAPPAPAAVLPPTPVSAPAPIPIKSPVSTKPQLSSTKPPVPTKTAVPTKAPVPVKAPVPPTLAAVPTPAPAPVPASTVASIPTPQPTPVPDIPTTPVSEPVAPSTPQKETVEPESIQSDTGETESPKNAPDVDPLAIETTAADSKSTQDQEKNVLDAETEAKEESEGEEEQSSEEESDGEKDDDPLSKTPPKTAARKPKVAKQEPKTEPKTPIQKSPSTGKTKRQRMMTQHYQSPLPEIEIITKISSSTPRNKNNDDKLIYFYKNEFLAVRNADGGFYLCQAVQNIYKSSSKIKIRWLSQDKSDKSGEIYTPDFYDLTDFDCILTSLDLTRVGKGRYKLKPKEKERTDSILKRCLAVEKGEISQPSVSEEHPDGLDLSLYKDEEQLMKKKKRGIKRKGRPRSVSARKEIPTRKTPEAPKVRKVEVKPATKNSTATTTTTKKVAPAKQQPVVPEPTTSPATSRSARGKRKIDTKSSPVMDVKKAKVLAKIGRKAAVPVSSSKPQTTSKSAKVSKPIPSTSKVTKPASPVMSKPPPRKAKRFSRK